MNEVGDIIYAWSCDATTGDKYRLLGDILGVNEYDHQTGIGTYVEETVSDTFDGTINDTTPTHTQKRKEEEWESLRTCWYIQKGFLKGVTVNLCDAIDEHFYSQLKHRHTAYRNTSPFNSSNTSTQHGALLTYKQRRNSRTPTSHSGTATNTLPRSVNALTTTRPPLSDPI